jgi:hypothetical protein
MPDLPSLILKDLLNLAGTHGRGGRGGQIGFDFPGALLMPPVGTGLGGELGSIFQWALTTGRSAPAVWEIGFDFPGGS